MSDVDEDHDLPTPRAARRPSRHREVPPHPRSIASLGKRSRGYSYSNSSDAPYFSSDDLVDAGAEDYATPRRKRQSRRTWWETDATNVSPYDDISTTHAITAPKDSGVFMSSDSSSNDDGFGVGELSAQNLKRHGKKFTATFGPRLREVEKPNLGPESVPRGIIAECLEKDMETVDLSGYELSSISNETLRPLRNLIRRPKFHKNHGVEEAFHPLSPDLQIYLSKNLLQRVPSEILNLEHLAVLSLRNNYITELPHSIGRLRNLRELNVAANRLKWLPWELLNLCGPYKRLQTLSLRPNPLFAPFAHRPTVSLSGSSSEPEAYREHLVEYIAQIKSSVASIDHQQDSDGEELAQKLTWILRLLKIQLKRLTSGESPDVCKKTPVRAGSTLNTFFDFDGAAATRSSQHPAPSQIPPRDERLLPIASATLRRQEQLQHPSSVRAKTGLSVPSLFELSLRTCADSLVFTDIDAHLPESTPDHVARSLEAAREASENDGGTRCCVCRGRYIVPRAEWVEYWHVRPDSGEGRVSFEDMFFPFLRRACSWRCADEAAAEAVAEDEAEAVTEARADNL